MEKYACISTEVHINPFLKIHINRLRYFPIRHSEAVPMGTNGLNSCFYNSILFKKRLHGFLRTITIPLKKTNGEFVIYKWGPLQSPTIRCGGSGGHPRRYPGSRGHRSRTAASRPPPSLGRQDCSWSGMDLCNIVNFLYLTGGKNILCQIHDVVPLKIKYISPVLHPC